MADLSAVASGSGPGPGGGAPTRGDSGMRRAGTRAAAGRPSNRTPAYYIVIDIEESARVRSIHQAGTDLP